MDTYGMNKLATIFTMSDDSYTQKEISEVVEISQSHICKLLKRRKKFNMIVDSGVGARETKQIMGMRHIEYDLFYNEYLKTRGDVVTEQSFIRKAEDQQSSTSNSKAKWQSSNIQELIDDKNNINERIAELCVEYILKLEKREIDLLLSNMNNERETMFKNLLNGLNEADYTNVIEHVLFTMLSKLYT